MAIPPTRKSLLKHYDERQKEVKDYFSHIPNLLVKEFPLNVSISYSFSQIELAHNMTLYCGGVKRHKANPTLARSVIDSHHMTRDDFQAQYQIVFGAPIPIPIIEHLSQAEYIRDKIMHGKKTLEKEKRKAIYTVLNYAESFNKEVYSVAGFRPFGPLQGFKGRAKPLDKTTTRWVLKGMGFHVG